MTAKIKRVKKNKVVVMTAKNQQTFFQNSTNMENGIELGLLKTETKPKRRSWPWILLIIFVLLIVGTVAAVGGFFWWYVSSFASAANVSVGELREKIKVAQTITAKQDEGQTNFLILGLDKITGQKETAVLTDTIMIASVNHSNNQISLISLPRDLWIDGFKTKINALYYYGEESETTTGEKFAGQIVGEITGLPIHYTVVVNLDVLKQIIDSVGEVEIEVPQASTDNEFPRADVDVTTVTDPALLYETVTFQAGKQKMGGETALKYIRSRHSEDEVAGSDLARSARQRDLIKALVDKVGSKEMLKNPHLLGNMYRTYKEQVKTNISDEEVLSLGLSLPRVVPQMEQISIPIQDKENPGLLINPPISKYQLWVYEPVDPSWNELQGYLREQLDR